jgi:cytochrome c553
VRRAAAVSLLWLLWLGAGLPAPATELQDGERIYREGMLPSGMALRALRENETRVEGATAACVNCHRRSGLGNVEGNYVVPPITAKYLMRSAADNNSDMSMPHVAGYHQGHVPYTDDSLARVLRDGIASDGRTLSALMPRYTLDDRAMADLQAYLRQLSTGPFPGVSDTDLQFATIITPDADPVARKAMLEVLQRFFTTQADVIAAETRPMKASREIKYRVTRQWHLHVWELSGPEATWEQQLDDHLRVEPVFAVVSGLGGANWAPVHRFCESQHVPCLFPNVDLPVVRETDFYPAYFSRGVLLEADLLAQFSADPARASGAQRLVQVYRRGDVGVAAAEALGAAVRNGGRAVLNRELAPDADAHALAMALDGVGPADILMLWLRPRDLAELPARAPGAGLILVSGLMGEMESAPLPAAWRPLVHMSYPMDLPQRRLARMNFPYGWFKVERLPVTSERVQVNTYLACVITAETLGHVLDSFVPDYLLERLEMMVSRRLANAYYPRLGLAPGQRFASKGGYIVHFDDRGAPAALPATADRRESRALPVVADTDWIVP